MFGKKKSFRKQRHLRDKEKGTGAAAGETVVDPDPTPPQQAAPKGISGLANAEIDSLISQLREHVEQGRIFEARAAVHKLQVLDSANPTPCSPASQIEAVRHLMHDVLAQADHVDTLLRELYSDDDWTLAKDKAGVRIHYRREANSPIHMVRSQPSNSYPCKDEQVSPNIANIGQGSDNLRELFPKGFHPPVFAFRGNGAHAPLVSRGHHETGYGALVAFQIREGDSTSRQSRHPPYL